MSADTIENARVQVLIIGAGPVGLSLAVELGLRGVRTMVIERGDGTVEHPRASFENARTMEFCRRWGIADAVRERGVPPDFPHTVLFVTSMCGNEIARLERPDHGGRAATEISPERPQRCNQIWFDRILADRAASLPYVSLHFGMMLEAFSQDEEGVTAVVQNRNTNRSISLRANYLVSCCGGRSPIPDSLNTDLRTTRPLGYPINIFFRTPELWRYHDKGKSALNFLVGPEGTWGNLTVIDGRDMWRLTLQGGPEYVDPRSIDAPALLRDAMGCDFPLEILSVVGWTRRHYVAGNYRFGRIFIAGDCAHQHSPSGGFGLNTGVGDAVDLGWKLAAVLAGWGGPRLLDSFEAERRPIAVRNVTEATGNFRRQKLADTGLIRESSAEGAAQRRALADRVMTENRRQFVSEGVALGYCYNESPVCVLEDEVPSDNVERYIPTTLPGARAPHARLGDGRSTLDLFGPGFTLLEMGEPSSNSGSIAAAAAQRGVPLSVHNLMEDEVRDLYQRRLVLVRPDGHVAWRGNEAPEDPLAIIDHVCGAA